jgi:hypothetical protein
VKNSSGKRRKKRKPQESCQERFLGPKNNFLKTGIGNLDHQNGQQRVSLFFTVGLLIVALEASHQGNTE